ncbi:MAG: SAM-dependent chlorinase/fluorinase [Deinococcus sp.]|nr:SAM-dependent chlorinase/fluorinase [Deinococcus sp.]
MSRIIALLTDFGHSDPYVGVMHGVILGTNPQVQVVDLCHQVLPQNVSQAAFLLRSAYPYFPTGTIFVAVVDPGVGSGRRILCLATPRYRFLAPDNGLLSLVEAPGQWIQVANRRYFLDVVSHTFQGRDIFAPVAAHLSLGLDPAELGPIVNDPQRLPANVPQRIRGELRAQVVHVDHFGNLITNASAADLAALGSNYTISIGQVELPGLHQTYTSVPPGELVALIGSSGQLEVAVSSGSASQRLGAGVGTAVLIRLRGRC